MEQGGRPSGQGFCQHTGGMGADTLQMEKENEKDGGENTLSYHSNFSLTSNILYVEIRGK